MADNREIKAVLVLCCGMIFTAAAAPAARTGKSLDVSWAPPGAGSEVVRVPVVEARDIRFRKLPNTQNLSQVRVSEIVQDDQGFLWFATWNGLNRYDGYKFKVFKHEAGKAASLSGVYIYALFKDRSGTLWVGTDDRLDRFDPVSETFRHYRIGESKPGEPGVIVTHISQDPEGLLWLSTRTGLFRFNPQTGELKNFRHDPNDPSTLGDNDVKSSGVDRRGTFWVGTSQTLDEFDRATGKVKRHVPVGESGVGLNWHEDRFGVFWIICNSDSRIVTFDRETNKLVRYAFDWGRGEDRRNQAYTMLEDDEGTMWFGTAAAGLMKYDRANRRFINYTHRADDSDSIADTRVISLFEDNEGNIWTGLHQVEPNYFSTKPLAFENLTRAPGTPNSVGPGLVSVLFEDRKGYLWAGIDRTMKRINRKTGEFTTLASVEGSEVLSIVEEKPDVLWFGNARPGLLRYDLRTGESKGYRHDPADPTTLCSGIVQRLMFDRQGTLWSATWDGLCRFDASTNRFQNYKPDPNARGLNYYTLAEDPSGHIWVGGNLGLHEFDPKTARFTIYGHHGDDEKSLSDNRVNAIFFDHSGAMWVGTQNGLDKFDPATRNFAVFDQRHGMAGNAVSCILEDHRGVIWMSTNKGISSFSPVTNTFANYSAADGLSGPDLTGWGACYQSRAGEMFFGGFSGVTAFFPDAVADSSQAPPTVLTEFRLFGVPVEAVPGSPLKSAINLTKSISLSHTQNVFSIEFSGLSYTNALTNRYRYRLDNIDHTWREVGSDERVATYTTLPAGNYTFHLQSATRRGPWSQGVTLAIQVLPPFWQTKLFLGALAAFALLVIWLFYQARLRTLARQFNIRVEERVGERTRIAQELHDTLLQNITGMALQMNGLCKRADIPNPIRERLRDLAHEAEDCLREARRSVWDIRSPESDEIHLAKALEESCIQFTAGKSTPFAFSVEGVPRHLDPELRQQMLRIGREAISNAVRHSGAEEIRVQLSYEPAMLRLRVVDDGTGFDLREAEQLPSHFGISTMRERAARIQGAIEISTSAGRGTCIEVTVPYDRGSLENAKPAYQNSGR